MFFLKYHKTVLPVKGYCKKSTAMVFARNSKKGGCGENIDFLKCVAVYRYLGIDFAYNGAWDVHVKEVIDSGRTKLSTKSARRILVLALVRLILE